MGAANFRLKVMHGAGKPIGRQPLRDGVCLDEGAINLVGLGRENAVIDYCARQYKSDKTIDALVRECAKYEEQPVIKQQFVAECMLAAYNYANALRTLKAEYRK